MINHRGWILWAFLVAACGGKSRGDGTSVSSAGQAENGGTDANGGNAGASNAGASNAGASNAGAGNAGAGNMSAGGAGTCPEDLAGVAPNEGADCPMPGLSCPGYGSLSCPLTAVCSVNSKWQINCPSTMMFGPCSCPHHDFGRVPNEHRATAIGCSHTRAASIVDPVECQTPDGGSICPNSECTQDSDCVNSELGDHGRCVKRSPFPGYACSYDTCFADSECADDSLCQCREPANGVGANYCTSPGNCRVDADCGESGYCSPSQAHVWCVTPFYACHTPDDECVNDDDCSPDSHCDFDNNESRWLCGNQCGAVPP